jgi:hypothetical protein
MRRDENMGRMLLPCWAKGNAAPKAESLAAWEQLSKSTVA